MLRLAAGDGRFIETPVRLLARRKPPLVAQQIEADGIQQIRVFLDSPRNEVAAMAEELANYACAVVVVDRQAPGGTTASASGLGLTTDGTQALLSL
jgi:hypothetical protein